MTYRTERIPEQPWRPTVRAKRRFSAHQQPPRPRGTDSAPSPKTPRMTGARDRLSAARAGLSSRAGAGWARVKAADLPVGWLLAGGGLLLVLGVAAAALLGPATSRSASNAQAQDGAVKSQVLALCAGGDQLARELQARGACDVAVKANQTPSVVDTGPTDAQVTRLIADYFTTHPNLYRPSVASVTEAARAVLESDPELYRGPLGLQGIPGPGPTEAQIANAVAAYIAAHLAEFQGPPGDPGKNGEPGAVGRGVAAGPRFERGGQGACESVVTYTDGSTDRAPAGDAACPGGSDSGGQSGPPATTEQPPPTAEQPNPTTQPPAPTSTDTPTAPSTTPTDPGLLGGLLGG